MPLLMLFFFSMLDIYNASKYNGCIDINKYFDVIFCSGFGNVLLICLMPFIYFFTPMPKKYIDMPNLYYIYVVCRCGLLLSIISQIIINIDEVILYNNTRIYNCILNNYEDKLADYNIYMDIITPIKLIFYSLLVVFQFIPLKI